jgi:hypothetical protein
MVVAANHSAHIRWLAATVVAANHPAHIRWLAATMGWW